MGLRLPKQVKVVLLVQLLDYFAMSLAVAELFATMEALQIARDFKLHFSAW